MNKLTLSVLATALSLATGCNVLDGVFGSKFALVDGERTATIVLPENAEDSTTYAADLLVKYVGKITGRKLEVRSSALQPSTFNLQPAIVIGTLKTLGEAVPKDVAERLRASEMYEANWTGVRDGVLWIVGKETPGEHYAVCHFIETKLGVRWFAAATPEDPGEYVPESDALKVEAFELYREPLFLERKLAMTGCCWYPIPTNALEVVFRAGFQPGLSYGHYQLTSNLKKMSWMDKSYPHFIRAHISVRTEEIGGGHCMFSDVAPEESFKDHPEYFPLVGTNRVCNHLYCVSNTNLLDLVVQRTVASFDKTNGEGHFLFGMADIPHGWCECANCKKWDDPESRAAKRGRPDVATRFAKAVAYMAPKIYAKHPNADLRRWAYHDYRDLPTGGVGQDPRIETEYCTYCRCHGHTLDDPTCARNRDIFKQIKAWRDFTGRGCLLYDYLCANSEEYYNCCETKEQADIKLYRKLGLRGWKNEMNYQDAAYPNWIMKNPRHHRRTNDLQASNWRFYYVVGRLLWDDSLDVEKMLDEVDRLYYGVAAEPMCAYQRLRRKLWNNSKVCFGYPWGNPRTAQLLNDLSAKEQLLKYLDEAEKLVAGHKVLAHRIAEDRRCLEDYWIKPNEKFRSKMGSAYSAPRPISPVVIDGKGDERAWTQAYYTEMLLSPEEKDGEHAAIPEKLRTSVGMLSDPTNLYFLVTAREPNPGKVSDADRLTFYLYPPAAENLVYRFTVGAEGETACVTLPSGEKRDIAIETKTRVGKDSWTMEVRIPVKDIHPIRSGDVWRVLYERTRGFSDDVAPKGSWTTDGADVRECTEYHRLEIDRAHLKNGSFEDLDAKGQLAYWGTDPFDGTNRVRLVHADGSGHYLKYKGTLSQEIKEGPLALSDKPRKFKYSFRAKGTGKGKDKVNVYFFRFKLVPPIWGQALQSPHGQGGDYTLTDEWKTYTGEYEIAAKEWIWVRLWITGDEVLIDDVQVMPEE